VTDRPAEHVGEQQHEHDGLDRRNTSRSGWQTKWRRLRPLTTAVSVMSARSSRGDRRRHCAIRLAAGRTTGGAGAAGVAGTLARAGFGWPSPVATPAPFSLGGAPVSCRNTSSSVGRRSPRSLTAISALRSAEAASSIISRPSRGAGSVSCASRSPGSGSPQPIPASATRALSRSAALTSSISRICPPTRSLSSLPVPWAITRPWSITAIYPDGAGRACDRTSGPYVDMPLRRLLKQAVLRRHTRHDRLRRNARQLKPTDRRCRASGSRVDLYDPLPVG